MTNQDRAFIILAFIILKNMLFLQLIVSEVPFAAAAALWFAGSMLAIWYGKEKI